MKIGLLLWCRIPGEEVRRSVCPCGREERPLAASFRRSYGARDYKKGQGCLFEPDLGAKWEMRVVKE